MSRRLIVGIGLLCLVIVAVLLAVVASSDMNRGLEPGPTGTAAQRPPLDQQGMLLAVQDETGSIADALVLAAKPTADGAAAAEIQIQPGLGLQFTDLGTATLARSGSESPQALQDRLAGQLGILIPNGLILDRLAFAALVDAAGGAVVDIPKPIYGRTATGRRVVLFPKGVQRLYGPAAADYAAYISPSEDQATRMARFAEVWKQTIAGLPSDEPRMRNLVGSLGALARNSTPVGVMATALLNYQAAQREGDLRSGTLPASAVGTSRWAVFTTDPVATTSLSRDLFPGLQTVGGLEGVPERVRLVGAGATGTQLVEAGARLSSDGAEIVYGGFAADEGISAVYVPRKGASVVAATWFARQLGLGPAGISVNPDRATGVNAAVWASADILPTPTPSPSETATAPGKPSPGAESPTASRRAGG